jgi:hypothetical protein
MTKRQFEEMFREEILPRLAERERGVDFPDKPARREAWNNTVDAYIRDRQLPESAGNWTHPRWLETWRPPQRSDDRDDYATIKKSKKSATQLNREIAEALGRTTKSARSHHSTIAAAPSAKPKRVPKTKMLWVVQGNYGYGHGWEDVTAAENWKEAKGYLRDYRENERGVPFRVIRRRERINP